MTDTVRSVTIGKALLYLSILGVATVQQKVDVVCRIPPLHDEDVMRSHDEEHLQIVVHLLRAPNECEVTVYHTVKFSNSVDNSGQTESQKFWRLTST